MIFIRDLAFPDLPGEVKAKIYPKKGRAFLCPQCEGERGKVEELKGHL
jgi:hypothetical protein